MWSKTRLSLKIQVRPQMKSWHYYASFHSHWTNALHTTHTHNKTALWRNWIQTSTVLASVLFSSSGEFTFLKSFLHTLCSSLFMAWILDFIWALNKENVNQPKKEQERSSSWWMTEATFVKWKWNGDCCKSTVLHKVDQIILCSNISESSDLKK